MKQFLISLSLVLLGTLSGIVKGHSTTHYLGNEGVMIENQGVKILFDPFFHNNYKLYTLVPEEIREAIFSNQAPYNNINALFISHAHGDHFDKTDVMKYMLQNKSIRLFAPKQAVVQLKSIDSFSKVENRITSIDLQKDDAPFTISIDGIQVEAVRIPHSGWPQRANIENIVFRVKLNKEMVFMHMGDADPNIDHFNTHKEFWPKEQTDLAFPPYWFSLSTEGKKIINKVINTRNAVGIHVPTQVPASLKYSGDDYFSKPGETRITSPEK